MSGTIDTMPRTHWMSAVHEAVIAKVGATMKCETAADSTGEWLRGAQAERLVLWFNTGETISGAVDMMVRFVRGAAIAYDSDGDRRVIRNAHRVARAVA